MLMPIQCSLLAKSGLADKIIYPDQSLYDDRMESYWSVSAALDPYCIALPESTHDVSKIIKVISKHDCKFGITGGGHGAFNGSNSISNGVTVDFGT